MINIYGDNIYGTTGGFTNGVYTIEFTQFGDIILGIL